MKTEKENNMKKKITENKNIKHQIKMCKKDEGRIKRWIKLTKMKKKLKRCGKRKKDVKNIKSEERIKK